MKAAVLFFLVTLPMLVLGATVTVNFDHDGLKVTQYQLDYQAKGATAWTPVATIPFVANQTRYQHSQTDVADGRYMWRVRAENVIGQDTHASEYAFSGWTGINTPPEDQAPGQPTISITVVYTAPTP